MQLAWATRQFSMQIWIWAAGRRAQLVVQVFCSPLHFIGSAKAD
jgi:hypothetical protein